MTWIQTASGLEFDLLHPTPEMVCLADIAKALSQTCRFGGHTCKFYSVAQHSVIVSSLLQDARQNRATVRWGLFHDAAEAYIGDITRPLKHLLTANGIHAITEIESNILDVIGVRFNLATCIWDEVKEVDLSLLLAERDLLMGTPPIPWVIDVEGVVPAKLAGFMPYSPREAEQLFLSKAYQLDIVD